MAFEAEQIAHLQEELASHQRRSTTDTATATSPRGTASRTTSPRTPVVVYNTTTATTPAALDIMSAIDASFSWLPSTTAPASDVRSEIADLHAEVRRLRQTPQANGTDLRNELRELRDEVRALSVDLKPTATLSINTLHHYSATTPWRGPSGPTSAGGRRRRTRLPNRGRTGRSRPRLVCTRPNLRDGRAPPRRFSERKRDAWPPEGSSVPGLFGDDVVGR